MPTSIEQFIEDAKNISLTADEKSRMRATLVSFIAAHPVSAEQPVRPLVQHARTSGDAKQRSGIFGWLSQNYLLKPMPIFLTLMLLVGAGTSFAAEKAFPGDALYPVKVGVNEEVRGWFAVSSEAKAEWETRRIERRLEEAEKLFVEGRFNADAAARIESSFQDHAERISARIARLEDQESVGALAAESHFETSLRVHEQILTKLMDDARDRKDEISDLADAVRIEAELIAQDRLLAEDEAAFAGENDEDTEKPETHRQKSGKLPLDTEDDKEDSGNAPDDEEVDVAIKTKSAATVTGGASVRPRQTEKPETGTPKSSAEGSATLETDAQLQLEAESISGEIESANELEVNVGL